MRERVYDMKLRFRRKILWWVVLGAIGYSYQIYDTTVLYINDSYILGSLDCALGCMHGNLSKDHKFRPAP